MAQVNFQKKYINIRKASAKHKYLIYVNGFTCVDDNYDVLIFMPRIYCVGRLIDFKTLANYSKYLKAGYVVFKIF